MLDLTQLDTSELYEIKLANGKLLKLKRPTQALQSFLMSLLSEKKSDDVKMLNSIFTAFTRVLNRNDEGIEFKEKDLADEYGIEVAALVINDYFTYWNEDTASKVDFQ